MTTPGKCVPINSNEHGTKNLITSEQNNDCLNYNNPGESCGLGNVDKLTPVNRDGKHLSDAKLRRLEKNRISARECRKRKKEANQVMEEEIERLESENLTLRLQLHVGIEADESTRQEQERLTQLITELLMVCHLFLHYSFYFLACKTNPPIRIAHQSKLFSLLFSSHIVTRYSPAGPRLKYTTF